MADKPVDDSWRIAGSVSNRCFSPSVPISCELIVSERRYRAV